MKSKAPLTLMEQLIMILVFALAAALCLQAFAAADRSSRESALRDQAVAEAQNAAEVLKGYGGDYEKAVSLCGGTWDGLCWTVQRDEIVLQATPADSGNPLLGCAEIQVTDHSGTVLFTLSAAWQKGGPAHE